MRRFLSVLFAVMACGTQAWADCDSGYYKNSDNVCTLCESQYYCPGDNMRYDCPALSTDSVYICCGGRASLASAPGSTMATQCYSDRTVLDSWIYEYQYHGFYRCYGKAYYSETTGKYNNCDGDKYFGECNAGYFRDGSAPEDVGFTNRCSPCPLGTYTVAVGTIGVGPNSTYHYETSCTPCASGTYTTSVGSTSCVPCPATPANATFVGSTGADACSWACNAGYGANSTGTCSALCAAGVTTWRTGSGLIIPLFATKNTTPSVNFGIGNSVCYADLVEGITTGAIHVEYNGKVYHTVN